MLLMLSVLPLVPDTIKFLPVAPAAVPVAAPAAVPVVAPVVVPVAAPVVAPAVLTAPEAARAVVVVPAVVPWINLPVNVKDKSKNGLSKRKSVFD